MIKLDNRINNNSDAAECFSLIGECIKFYDEMDGKALEHIKVLYDVLNRDIDTRLLSDKYLGKYLGLKVFFCSGLDGYGIFSGNEVISQKCEKEMYKTLKDLCFLSKACSYSEFKDANKDVCLETNEELNKIYSILNNDFKILFDNMDSFKRRSDFSSELRFVLNSFDDMRQPSLNREYMDSSEDISIIPYYYVSSSFIKEYSKLGQEYKNFFQKLYEYQLKYNLKTNKINVDSYVSESNRLVCVVSKKKQKINK